MSINTTMTFMAPKKKETLSCAVSTKFTPTTYRRLLLASRNSKRHFKMSSVPVAEIVRVAVEQLLDELDAKAASETAISE